MPFYQDKKYLSYLDTLKHRYHIQPNETKPVPTLYFYLLI